MESKPVAQEPWTRLKTFGWLTLEWAGLFLVFAIHGGGGVPHVNEAHYICKAKHYWDPSWCSRDLFLGSAEAHGLFYQVFGWLTLFFSLEVTAWLTRFVCWGLLAVAWVRFSRVIIQKPGTALLSGWLFSLLVLRTHMSGEWVVGGAEAKVIAYFFLLLGLRELVAARWLLVWPLFGLSSAFHVLVGGWAVLAGLFVFGLSRQDRPALIRMIPSLVAGFAISLIGLVPALSLTLQADPEQAAIANKIYVFDRLSHHLVFATFPPAHVIRHFSLVSITLIGWLFLWKQVELRRLGFFALAAFLLVLIGIGIDSVRGEWLSQETSASLLKFYWFRLSDAVFPIVAPMVALGLGRKYLAERYGSWWKWLAAGTACLMCFQLAVQGRDNYQAQPPAAVRQSLAWTDADPPEVQAWKRQLYQDWLATCNWVESETEPDTLWLTPRNQQTFKWYAQRAEVANWKDVPQDAATILRWRLRMKDVYEYHILGPLNLTDAELLDLVSDYEIDYLLVERRSVILRERIGAPLPFKQVYPEKGKESEYLVYQVD